MNKSNEKSLFGSLSRLLEEMRSLDFATVFVFVAVAVISTINYYYGGRRFIKGVFADVFASKAQLVFWSAVIRNFARFGLSFLLPMLLILWPLKARLRKFGLGIGDWRFGLKVTGIFILIMLPILWIVSASPAFSKAYPNCPGIKADWTQFGIYAASLILYMTGWEFLWRGFMLFGLKDKLGYYAIFVQTIPFTILHFGKPFSESMSAIVAGIALGIIAWRTRSFWYCVITHAAVIILINLLAVLRLRAGNYELGLRALKEVFGVMF